MLHSLAYNMQKNHTTEFRDHIQVMKMRNTVVKKIILIYCDFPNLTRRTAKQEERKPPLSRDVPVQYSYYISSSKLCVSDTYHC